MVTLSSHIAIAVNPVKHRRFIKRLCKQIIQELILRNISFVVFNEQWPDSFENFSDIWLVGGDGTLNYFINHYSNCKIPLSVFKGGTGNDFAWMLYGNISVKEQIQRIIESLPKNVDAGKMNDQLFINCIGIGFDGEILASSMNSIRFIGGHFGYLLAVIKKIFSFKEYHFIISTPFKKWEEKFLLLMVTNAKRVGGGFYIAPEALINDGKLNLVMVQALSVFKRFKYLPVIEKGKHLQLPFVISSIEEKIFIIAEKELAVQVDGELFYANKLHIEVLPNQFLFRY